MSLEQLELTVGPWTFDAVARGRTDGPPVLLLHGFPQSGRCWAAVQERLDTAGFRTVAPDLRGYSPGARPAEASAYTVAELRADVLGIADQLGWDTFHLIGHDWGGALAWHVAGAHPERLRSLLVVSTPHPAAFTAAKKAGPTPDGDDQAERSGYIGFFRTPESTAAILADDQQVFRLMMEASGMSREATDHHAARLSTPEALDGALNWYRGADPADARGLGPITTPTTYLWSTEDVALGRTAAEATEQHVQGPYTFLVHEGGSHWLPEQAPDVVAQAFVELAASLP